jgi:hypothetical protein
LKDGIGVAKYFLDLFWMGHVEWDINIISCVRKREVAIAEKIGSAYLLMIFVFLEDT